jgi:hypothetical protein
MNKGDVIKIFLDNKKDSDQGVVVIIGCINGGPIKTFFANLNDWSLV